MVYLKSILGDFDLIGKLVKDDLSKLWFLVGDMLWAVATSLFGLRSFKIDIGLAFCPFLSP